MRRIARIALLIAALPAVLLLLAAAILLFAKVGALDGYALNAIKTKAAASGITIEVDKFQLDPFVPSVRVIGLKAKGPEDAWFADCPDIYLSLKPFASLAGDLTFSLLAEKPRIKGAMPRKAESAKAGERKSSIDLSAYSIERIRITDGSVDLAFPEKEARIVLSGFNVDWLEKRGKGSIAGGSVIWKGETEELLNASFEGEKSGAETRLEAVNVRSTRTALTGGMRVGVFDSLTGEFNLRADLRDLPEKWLEGFGLGARRPVGGLVELLGQVGGSLDAPTLNGVLDVNDGSFSAVKITGLNANFDLNGEGLKIKKLSAKTTSGTVRNLTGTLGWTRGVKLKADADLEKFDLRAFMMQVYGGTFPVGLVGTGKISAKGDLSPTLALECAGKGLDITNFDVTTQNGQPITRYSLPKASLDVNASVGAQKIEFSKSRIDAGSVTVDIPKGQVVYREGLEFDTAFNIKSLETIKQYLPEGFDAALTAKGRFGGPYHELKFDYDLDVTSSEIFGQPFGRINGHANYDLETLRLDKVSVVSQLGEANVDGMVRLREGGEYNLDTTVEGGDLARLREFLAQAFSRPELPSFQGQYGLKGRLSGTLKQPVFKGEIALKNLIVPKLGEFKGAKVDSVNAEGAFGIDSWKVEKIAARVGGTLIEGNGEADTKSYRAKAKISSLRLEEIKEYFEHPVKVGGVFEGMLESAGNYTEPLATLSGEVGALAVQDVPVGKVNVSLDSNPKGLFGSVELFDKTAKIEASLNKGLKFSAKLILDRFPWTSVPERFRLEGFNPGTITGTASAEAQLGKDPVFDLRRAEFQGVLSDLLAGSFRAGEARVALSYPERGKGLLKADVSIWEGKASGSLLVDPLKLKEPEFTLRLASIDLNTIPGMPKKVKKGKIDLDAKVAMLKLPPESKELNGILQEVSKARITGSLAGVEVQGYPRPIDMEFEIGGDPREWILETALPPLRNVVAKITLEDMAWNISAMLGDCDPSVYFPGLAGKVKCSFDGAIEARGRIEKLEDFHASGEVRGIEAYGIGPVNGKWMVQTEDWGKGPTSGISFSLDLPGSVSLAGVWFSESGIISLDLAMHDTRVEEWFPTTLKDKGISGIIDARAEVAFEKDGRFNGVAKVAKLNVNTPKGRVENSGEMLVTFDQGKINFEKVALLYEGLEWNVTGNMKPGEGYDVKGKVTLNLEKFVKNVPHVESVSGTATLEAGVTGPWASPKITGNFEVGGGCEIKIDKLAYPFSKVTAHAELTIPGDLRIEEVTANFGEGSIHAEGRVIMKDFLPDHLEVFVETRNIHYEYPRGATYDFDGDFMVTGPLKQVEIRGETRIKNFLHSKTIMWRSATLALTETAKKSRVGAKETGDIYIDIAILGDRNVKVENNIANLDLALDMRVKGYLPSPELLGRLDVNTGTLRFRGREYQVLRSNIEFMGNVGPFAVLDGRATTSIGEYTVNVSATGPLEDIKVDLSSVPALPRTDIVALLALGTTSENLENSEVVTAFEATNILTGSIQDELEGQAYNVFGIDQLQINPTYSKSRQTTVPQLTVGKALSNSVFARYATELGVSAEQEVRLEYLFKPGVIFMGTWSDQGTEARGSFGGEVRFRHTFR